MLGTINAQFDRMVREDNGIIVSFRIADGHTYAAQQTVATIKQEIANGKPQLELKIDHPKKRRTNNANAYFWVLCSRVADKLGTLSDELYRRYIKEAGLFQVLSIDAKAVKTLGHVWNAYGTGWFIDVLDAGSDDRQATVKAYYGSSSYDGKHMARLIDRVKDDCEELGIPTIDEEELDALISRWLPNEK